MRADHRGCWSTSRTGRSVSHSAPGDTLSLDDGLLRLRVEAIIAAVDGIMVARGDLGVELAGENVPLVQKRCPRAVNAVGKLVPYDAALALANDAAKHAGVAVGEAIAVVLGSVEGRGTEALFLRSVY